MAWDRADRSASRSARGRKCTWQPVTPESSPRSARRDSGAMAQSGTVDRYDRIAVGYQRWWAPVIAPAALRLLDLVASTVVGRPGAHVVDVGSRARGPSPAPRSRAGRRSGHRGRTRAGDARGGGAG